MNKFVIWLSDMDQWTQQLFCCMPWPAVSVLSLKKFSYILFSYTHSRVSQISKMDAWTSHIYCTYDFIPSYIWLQNIKKKYLYQLKAFVKTLGTFCIKLF